jgi:hypothetical protein
MNKFELQGNVKSQGTAYLFFFLFGAHFAYLGKWGLQFLFWFTLGGFFVWGFIELFMIPGRVQKHNAEIYHQIDEIEKRDRDADLAKNIAMIKAVRE